MWLIRYQFIIGTVLLFKKIKIENEKWSNTNTYIFNETWYSRKFNFKMNEYYSTFFSKMEIQSKINTISFSLLFNFWQTYEFDFLRSEATRR